MRYVISRSGDVELLYAFLPWHAQKHRSQLRKQVTTTKLQAWIKLLPQKTCEVTAGVNTV